MMRSRRNRMSLATLFAVVCFAGTALRVESTWAEDGVPEPDLNIDPVEVDQVAAGRVVGQPVGGYRSEMLKASFLVQWMKLSKPSRSHLFWGARITHLDNDSPLKSLRLMPNDVITRLDGVSVAKGMKMKRPAGDWQAVQMENHFSKTKVRYIFHKTKNVQENEVDLGPLRKAGTPNAGLNPLDP